MKIQDRHGTNGFGGCYAAYSRISAESLKASYCRFILFLCGYTVRKQICPTRLHKKQQRRFRVVQLRRAQRRVVCNPRHGEGIPNAPCIGEHHAFSGVQLTDKGEAVLTAAAANDQCPAIQCSTVARGAERE